MAMRSFVEAYEKQASAERQFNQITGQMQATPALQDDPENWTNIGLLSLLRGRYSEAIGLFESGRKLLPDDPAAQSRLYGWEALAAHLAGQPAQALQLLTAGAELDPQNELLHQQLIVAQGALAP
jgi:tetratricopeptide (TPR) repeat protein